MCFVAVLFLAKIFGSRLEYLRWADYLADSYGYESVIRDVIRQGLNISLVPREVEAY